MEMDSCQRKCSEAALSNEMGPHNDRKKKNNLKRKQMGNEPTLAGCRSHRRRNRSHFLRLR